MHEFNEIAILIVIKDLSVLRIFLFLKLTVYILTESYLKKQNMLKQNFN